MQLPPLQLCWRFSTGSQTTTSRRLRIFAWSGHFYAVHAVERLGLAGQGGLMRIGINHYNTADEVRRLIGALRHLSSRP